MIAYYAEKGDQSLETVNSCAVLCPTMYEEKQTEIIWIAFFFFFSKMFNHFFHYNKTNTSREKNSTEKKCLLKN